MAKFAALLVVLIVAISALASAKLQRKSLSRAARGAYDYDYGSDSSSTQLKSVQVDSVSVDHVTWAHLCSGGCSAKVDPDQYYITGPTAQINRLNGILGFQSSSSFPSKVVMDCDEVKDLPNVSIVIKGKSYELTPSDYTYTAYGPYMYTMCASAFTTVPSMYNDQPWVLGSVFLDKHSVE